VVTVKSPEIYPGFFCVVLCGLASEQLYPHIVGVLKTRFVMFSVRLASHVRREAAQIE